MASIIAEKEWNKNAPVVINYVDQKQDATANLVWS
jgi:hypothetical protein